MKVGPGLVIRGTLVGCLLVALLGFSVTASAKSLTNVLNDQASQTANSNTANTATVTQPAPAVEASADQASSQSSAEAGDCQISSKFPASIAQWCSLITGYAQKYGLQPNLVAAVMLQESGGNPQAYSSSGAVGLLQVMPSDGIAAGFQCASGPCFTNRPTIAELQNPEFNIDYGTRMLSGLISKYGNTRDALKAYGPQDVGYYYADIILKIFSNYG